MKTVLNWTLRVLLFPFVVAIWLLGGIVMGLVVPFDWLINPSKWNGFNRKDIER